MTAEIAILNKKGVALAADSVVTLSGASGSKTYDSAEKIFELSRCQPIGLMAYNNSELISIPLEVLVREFREQSSEEFVYLTDVWSKFKCYLLDLCEKPEFDETATQLQSLITAELKNLETTFMNTVMRQTEEGGLRLLREPEQFLEGIIDKSVSRFEIERLEGFLENVTLEDFIAKYGMAINSLLEQSKVPFVERFVQILAGSEGLQKKFYKLAFSLVRSRKRSPSFTGLVFAGFGNDDRFPSIHSVEIDGIYYNQVRIIQDTKVRIDHRGETAAVVPFAQKDMPERFMYGMDHVFEDKLMKIAADLTAMVLEQAPASFSEVSLKEIQKVAEEWFKRSIEVHKRGAYRELHSVVSHLSKKELAEVAYSLVELTSRKRRYSSGMETVGGPIDVAILTRNEGFIWVRRKRYFDIELNPAYTERLKQTMRKTGGQDE